MSQDILSYLALYSVPEIGPRRMIYLVKKLGSAQLVLDASPKELENTEDIGEKIAYNIKNKADWKLAEEQLKLTEEVVA